MYSASSKQSMQYNQLSVCVESIRHGMLLFYTPQKVRASSSSIRNLHADLVEHFLQFATVV